jgi:TPR repeat protein
LRFAKIGVTLGTPMTTVRSPLLALSLAAVASSLASVSCGPGAAAEAIRPKDPSAAAALGDGAGSCHEVEKYGEPLVVDWKPDQRGDLEEVMHDGVAVVAYSCSGIKLLKQCHIEGSYGYLGMTKREQVVRLQNADELRANLPLSGLKIAGEIGGEMNRGTTLDIALVTVGKRRTTWKSPTRDDLKGDCDGATHVVRGAAVGAFAVQTGTQAEVKTSVQIFGAGAGAGSSSAKDVNDKEGDPTACSSASPDATSAPSQCGAAVRIELVAIGDAAAKQPPAPPDKQASATADKSHPLEVEAEPCPKGLVLVEGKCTTPTDAKPHQCEPGDQPDCQKQCDSGHAGSCGALGAIFEGRTHEYDKALAALKKGCDGGDTRSCVNLGGMTLEGLGTKADPTAAATLFDGGCNNGDAVGCARLGTLTHAGTGVTKDDTRAAALLRKGCEGGQARACGELGSLTRDGAGVTKDDAAAMTLFRRGCSGDDARSCRLGGEAAEARDAILASILFQRGCYAADFQESGRSCAGLGRILQAGPMADPARAKDAYEWACNKMNNLGCAVLKVAYGGTRPVFPDVGEEIKMEGVCNGGNARACATLGVLQIAENNPMGKSTLQRACDMNDQWGCALKAKAH